MSYPTPRNWLFEIDFSTKEPTDKRPELRRHKWSRDNTYEGYYCTTCHIAITNEFVSQQDVVENITESALDLLWFMFSRKAGTQEHRCPQ